MLGCTGDTPNFKLLHIDELLRKDSVEEANAQLKLIDKKYLISENDVFFYKLLKIQILSRQYKTIPCKLLDECIEYYKKEGNDNNLATAYYYKGEKLYEEGEVTKGITLYKKAQKYANLNDIQLCYKISEALAYANSNSGNYNIALNYIKQCCDYAQQLKSADRYVFSKYLETINYARLGFADSSEMSLKQYIPYLYKTDPNFRRIYLAKVCVYYSELEEWEQTEHYLKEALLLGDDPVVCGLAGYYYMQKGHYVMAEEMFNKEIAIANKFDYKIAAYHNLGLIRTYQKDYKGASEYYAKENLYKDSLAMKNQEEMVKDTQYKFDIDEFTENSQKRLDTMQYLLITVVLVLCLGCFFFIYTNNKRRKELRLAAKQIEEYGYTISELRKNHATNQKAIAHLTKEIKNSMERYVQKLSQGHRLYEGLALGRFVEKRDKRTMENLLAFYRIIDEPFFEEIERKYDNLTIQGKTILMLRHLGKDDGEIARILGVREGSMRSYLSRIRNCRREPDNGLPEEKSDCLS